MMDCRCKLTRSQRWRLRAREIASGEDFGEDLDLAALLDTWEALGSWGWAIHWSGQESDGGWWTAGGAATGGESRCRRAALGVDRMKPGLLLLNQNCRSVVNGLWRSHWCGHEMLVEWLGREVGRLLLRILYIRRYRLRSDDSVVSLLLALGLVVVNGHLIRRFHCVQRRM